MLIRQGENNIMLRLCTNNAYECSSKVNCQGPFYTFKCYCIVEMFHGKQVLQTSWIVYNSRIFTMQIFYYCQVHGSQSELT